MAKKKGSETGNYKYDVGELADQAIRGRYGLSGPKRPWSPGHSTGIGASRWGLGDKLSIPAKIDSQQLVIGGLIGVAGQRAMRRITPAAAEAIFGVNLDKAIVVDLINFGVGAIPFVAIAMTKEKKGIATGVGIALPGLFQLGGTLADLLLDYTPLKRKALAEPKAKKEIAGGTGKQAADRLRKMAGKTRQQQVRTPQSFAGRVPA